MPHLRLWSFLKDLITNMAAAWPLWLLILVWLLVAATLLCWSERPRNGKAMGWAVPVKLWGAAFYMVIATFTFGGFGDTPPRTVLGKTLCVVVAFSGIVTLGIIASLAMISLEGKFVPAGANP